MKHILTILILGTIPCFAQLIVQQPGQFNNAVQMVPGAVPTSRTCLVGFSSSCLYVLTNTQLGQPTSINDPFVCSADFTGTGQTITLSDINTTPWVVGGAVLGSSGSPVGWVWTAPSDLTCRRFPGGVYIQAGSSGATGSVTVKFMKR